MVWAIDHLMLLEQLYLFIYVIPDLLSWTSARCLNTHLFR